MKWKNIKENGGYARLSELRNQGFQTREITKLYDEGVLEKVQPGLYKLMESDITFGFVDVSIAMPQGVVALVSALAYYELTTFNPSRVHVAIPNDAKPVKINFLPVDVWFLFDNHFIDIDRLRKATLTTFEMQNTPKEDF